MFKVIYPEAGKFFCRPLGRYISREAGETITFQSERAATFYADKMNEWNKAEVCRVEAA